MVKNSNMKTFQITFPKGIRLGQILFDFLEWLNTQHGIDTDGESRMADPFYLSDDRMIELWHQYLQYMHAYDRKQEQED